MGAHSRWGMSGQSRIITCPGSVKMCNGIVEPTNEQAEIGTCVHEASEFAYRTESRVEHLTGFKFNNIKLTQEMADDGQLYVDTINKFKSIPGINIRIESKVCISSIDPERLWGTGDFIAIDLANRTLYIGDYKNGYVGVDVDGAQTVFAYDNQPVEGNAQLMGYALGALDTYGLWDLVDNVLMFIVQPNKDHIKGPVRSRNFTIGQLKEWHKVYNLSHNLSLSDNPPRSAGPQCKYCPAKGFCSTRLKHQLELLMLDDSIAHCTPDQLLNIYKESDVIIKTVEAVKEQVVTLARKGHKVDGFKLVKGIARAKCTNEDEFVKRAVEKGYSKSDLYRLKLKGKTDVKGVVGKDLANEFFINPPISLTLVPDNNPRVAYRADMKPDAKGIFGDINNV